MIAEYKRLEQKFKMASAKNKVFSNSNKITGVLQNFWDSSIRKWY